MASLPKQRHAGDTSKAKPKIAEELGMSLPALEQQTICWVPVPMDGDLRNLMLDLASVRKTTTRSILSGITLKAVEASRAVLEKEAAKASRARVEDLTEDELAKKMASMQRQLEALNKALAAKKGG